MSTDRTDPSSSDGFAALFEQSGGSAPRSQRLTVGARVEAVVSRITKDAVFVDLDAKRPAYLEAVELTGPDGALTVKVGDKLSAHVVEVGARGGAVRLGRSLGKANDVASLQLAREQGMAVEGKVVAVNKGGVEVEVGGVKAFCPMSQLDTRPVADPTTLINQSLQFRVTEVREGGRKVVLSRRAVLEADAKEASARLLGSLQVGAVVKGAVSGVREFGAFVDLGGVEGLVPASELSHASHVKVADVVKPGDLVEVQVKEIRPQEGGGARITLSLKALAPDPWESLTAVAPVGRVVAGTVTRTTDFGVFVRLVDGVEGLVHVSELPGREPPAKRFQQGQPLLVLVKSADPAARKISLVPAPEGSAAGGAYAVPSVVRGSIVKAVVDKIESYGVFVQVDGVPGKAGRGLVPMADLGVPRGADLRKHFSEGAVVTAKVLETGDGRLRLSLRAVKEDEERANYEGYQRGARTSQKLGTFADLLAKKLGK